MMNLGRVWVIATNVFREVIRDRILYLIGVFAVLLVLASRLLPEVASIAADKILIDLGLGAIAILGAIVAVFVGTGLVNKEIEKRTLLVLLAKPLRRGEFIVGKHLGLSAVLTVLVVSMGAIYLGLLRLYGIPFPVSAILTALGFLLIELSLLSAIALGFGVVTSSLLASLFSFGMYLIGNLSPDLVKLAKLTDNPNLKQIVHSLYLVLPDFSRFNLRNEAVYGLLPEPSLLVWSGVYAVLYIAIALSLATLLFSRRQF